MAERQPSPQQPPSRPITKTVVDRLQPGQIAWDAEVKGFGVRCQRRYKIFILKYRIFGRPRWISIGKHGSPWTVELARKEAKRLQGKVAAGIDPAEARDQAKNDLTISELCDLYLKEGCTTKKPSTLATDRSRIERHIKPSLGRRRVRQIRRGDVERLLRDIADGKTATDEKTGFRGRAIVTGGKGTATKAVALLGAIFSFAVVRGLCPVNPAQGVKTFKTRNAERFLSAEELSRLGEALSGAEREGANPFAIAAIRLLALTGARKSEILTLHWEPNSAGPGHVDFEHSCLHLTDSKTGSKECPLVPRPSTCLPTSPGSKATCLSSLAMLAGTTAVSKGFGARLDSAPALTMFDSMICGIPTRAPRSRPATASTSLARSSATSRPAQRNAMRT